MSAAPEADVLVIAVSFFGSDDVPDLLSSLQHGGGRWRLLVVDNAGDDSEHQALRAALAGEPRAAVVNGRGNSGYFGGARRGLRDAGGPASWTVVANTDLRFSPDFVERLSRFDQEAVVAPAIVSGISGADQNPFLDKRPSQLTVLRWRLQFASITTARLVVALGHLRSAGTRRARPDSTPLTTPAPRQVYAPHGSCVAFPSAYFGRGGSLEHAAFMFGEEITLAERAHTLGMPVLHVPELVVQHAEHRATGRWRSRQMLSWQRDSVREIARLLRGRRSG